MGRSKKMRSFKVFTCYSLVVAFILFASIAMVEAANTESGGNPMYETQAVTSCTNIVDIISYGGGNLSLVVTVGTSAPAKLNIYLAKKKSVVHLEKIKIPVTDPPETIYLDFRVKGFKGIGVLSTLTTKSEGIICSDWTTHSGDGDSSSDDDSCSDDDSSSDDGSSSGHKKKKKKKK